MLLTIITLLLAPLFTISLLLSQPDKETLGIKNFSKRYCILSSSSTTFFTTINLETLNLANNESKEFIISLASFIVSPAIAFVSPTIAFDIGDLSPLFLSLVLSYILSFLVSLLFKGHFLQL